MTVTAFSPVILSEAENLNGFCTGRNCRCFAALSMTVTAFSPVILGEAIALICHSQGRL